jgi:hypothetical protein
MLSHVHPGCDTTSCSTYTHHLTSKPTCKTKLTLTIVRLDKAQTIVRLTFLLQDHRGLESKTKAAGDWRARPERLWAQEEDTLHEAIYTRSSTQSQQLLFSTDAVFAAPLEAVPAEDWSRTWANGRTIIMWTTCVCLPLSSWQGASWTTSTIARRRQSYSSFSVVLRQLAALTDRRHIKSWEDSEPRWEGTCANVSTHSHPRTRGIVWLAWSYDKR